MISFNNLNLDFKLKKRLKIKIVLKKIVLDYDKVLGNLSFIFTNDSSLLEINQKYLNHDFYTDVITFDFCEKNVISGDIYISIDRVYENSKIFNVTFNEELLRVIIHGVLHLVGLNDKINDEKLLMSQQENFYLDKFSKNDKSDRKI